MKTKLFTATIILSVLFAVSAAAQTTQESGHSARTPVVLFPAFHFTKLKVRVHNQSVAAECPEQFLCKVLQNLTRAGLMISHRGNTGGFELEELHRTASILEVVEAIEGPIRLNLCLTSDHACTRQSWCPAHCVWADAQAALLQVLRESNITQLAEQAARSRRPPLVVIGEPDWN